MAENEIKDPWYEVPAIKRVVEEANGHTIYNDMQDPNRNRDPYAPSRDLVYYMKLILPCIQKDLFRDEMTRVVYDVAGRENFDNKRLIEGFNSMIDMINGFVGSGRSHVGQTLDEVAEEFGYAQLESYLKVILEAILGRYFLGSFFFAAKSLTPTGGKPLADIGYNGTFDFVTHETNMALDGIETEYARKIKNERKSD